MADDYDDEDTDLSPIYLDDLGISIIPLSDEGAESADELSRIIEIGRAEWEKQLYVKGGGKLN